MDVDELQDWLVDARDYRAEVNKARAGK